MDIHLAIRLAPQTFLPIPGRRLDFLTFPKPSWPLFHPGSCHIESYSHQTECFSKQTRLVQLRWVCWWTASQAKRKLPRFFLSLSLLRRILDLSNCYPSHAKSHNSFWSQFHN